jgi:hypothetical protein
LDEDKLNTYWFSGKYPNELLKMIAWDGRMIELQDISRKSYWLDE